MYKIIMKIQKTCINKHFLTPYLANLHSFDLHRKNCFQILVTKYDCSLPLKLRLGNCNKTVFTSEKYEPLKDLLRMTCGCKYKFLFK